MTELLTGLTPQPDFPREDLTPDNADMLEMMMANREIVDAGHAAAERTVWSFKVGHAAIRRSVGAIYDKAKHQEAIDHGVATFEAIAAMVGGEVVHMDSFPIHVTATNLLHLSPHALGDYHDESLDSFRDNAPRTAEVIQQASRRFYGPLAAYALLGAALSWQFERDTD